MVWEDEVKRCNILTTVRKISLLAAGDTQHPGERVCPNSLVMYFKDAGVRAPSMASRMAMARVGHAYGLD
jgi:hypothetical protein